MLSLAFVRSTLVFLCYTLDSLLSSRIIFIWIDCIIIIGGVYKDNDTWREYSATIPTGLPTKQCFRRADDSCTAGRMEIWLFKPVHFIHRPWNRCSKLTRRVVPLVCPLKHLIIFFFKPKSVMTSSNRRTYFFALGTLMSLNSTGTSVSQYATIYQFFPSRERLSALCIQGVTSLGPIGSPSTFNLTWILQGDHKRGLKGST